MPPTTETSSWDFAPVLDLLHSFSADNQPPRHDIKDEYNSGELGDRGLLQDGECAPSLGDFSSLWTFLAQSPPPDTVNSGLKNQGVDVENVNESLAKGGQHDNPQGDAELKGDVFAVSPDKQRGKPTDFISTPFSASISHEKSHNQ